jgi:hypothetical protein
MIWNLKDPKNSTQIILEIIFFCQSSRIQN